MIRIVTIFSIFLFVTIRATAQYLSIDSIRNELQIAKHDTDRIYTTGWLAHQLYLRGKYDSSFNYANETLAMSERINYEKGKGYAYILLGNHDLDYFKDYGRAIRYYSKAKRIMEKLNDKLFLAIATTNLGKVYTLLTEKPEGIEHLNVALKQFEELDDHTNAAYVLRHLATYYDSRGHTTKALELFFASLKKTDKTGDETSAETLQAIAAIYITQGNNGAAIEYSTKALETNKAIGSEASAAQNHNTIAKIYLNEKRYNNALFHIQSALTIFKELGKNAPDWGLPWCYLLIGNVYELQGDSFYEPLRRDENYDNAEKNYRIGMKEAIKNNSGYVVHLNYEIGKLYYKQKEYQLARSHLQNSLDTSSKYDELETFRDVSLYLSRLDSLEGNYKMAFTHYKRYILIRDSIVNQDLKSKSEDLKMQYEFDKKEDSLNQKQIITQTKLESQKKQKNFYLVGAGLLGLLSLFVFLNFRNQKKINRLADEAHAKERAELELQSLRAQLNPHFMFNSLNAIQELILLEENEKSQSYLARFAKLLRLLLENADKPFIPLQREIDFLQLYLSLENLRIPDLEFSITVNPEINTEATQIPNMILQPYIENAIWHGLSHKTNDKRLQIRISIENGFTKYEIEDNGVGRKRSSELKSLYRKEHKSKGMELLSKRFKLLAKEYGSEVQTTVTDIENGKDSGTIVTIKVPGKLKHD